eukprot:tig00000144_g9077.t1
MAISRGDSARAVDAVTADIIWRDTINKEFWTDKHWSDHFGGITGNGPQVQARRARILGEVSKEYYASKAAREAARQGNLKNAWAEAGEKQLAVDGKPDPSPEEVRRRASAAPAGNVRGAGPVPKGGGPVLGDPFVRRAPSSGGATPPPFNPYYYDEQLAGWEGLADAPERNQHAGVKTLPVAPHRMKAMELARAASRGGQQPGSASLLVAGEISHPNKLKKGLTKPPQYTPAEVLNAHMREQLAKQAHLRELSLPNWLQKERAAEREKREARRRAKSAQPRPAPPADENDAPGAAAAPGEATKGRPASAAAAAASQPAASGSVTVAGNVTIVREMEPPRRIQASHGSAAYERGTARGRSGAGLSGSASAPVSSAELPLRERLAALEPKEKYLRPITTYMELGWNLKRPMIPVGLELFGVAEHANGHAKDLMPAYFGIGSTK